VRLVSYSVYLVGILLIVGSSSVPKNFAVTGGSRSDATLSLSYEYGMFDAGKGNVEQGREIAIRRCKNWGYDEVESFDQGLRNCVQRSNSGCLRWRVTMQYQCIGNGLETPNSNKNNKKAEARCTTAQILSMSQAGFDEASIGRICD